MAETIDIGSRNLAVAAGPNVGKAAAVDIEVEVVDRGGVATSENAAYRVVASIDASGDGLARGRVGSVAAAEDLVEGVCLVVAMVAWDGVFHVGSSGVGCLPDVDEDARLWRAVHIVAAEDRAAFGGDAVDVGTDRCIAAEVFGFAIAIQ